MTKEGVSDAGIDTVHAARDGVVAARRVAAAALAAVAVASVRYADARTAADRRGGDLNVQGPGRVKPGEFVADELSVLLREQPFGVRRLLTRSRRLAADLPTVWAAHGAGAVDAEQVRVIDRVARQVTHARTLAAIDDQAVAAAQTRCPKQLTVWLLRLVVRLEPLPFAQRHRRALAERRVCVVQGADGMGYVTGEVSAADAAAIDAMLAAAARSLGADDPRTDQQRRADLFSDILLGRLRFADDDPEDADHQSRDGRPQTDPDVPAESAGVGFASPPVGEAGGDGEAGWLEVEDVDPDTGELLGTRYQRLDPDGEPLGEPVAAPPVSTFAAFTVRRRPRTLRIGVVVPLSSLLGAGETPGELTDRSAPVPAETLRQLIADTLNPDPGTCHPTGADRVLFTRLLTDDGGRLLDTTELGRYASHRLAQAIQIRAGTCRFPTCSVPADRCDLDHHEPVPRGPTSAANLDPLCRRHHRGKTFAWLATVRDHDAVDWTMPDAHHYRCVDDPLPTDTAA